MKQLSISIALILFMAIGTFAGRPANPIWSPTGNHVAYEERPDDNTMADMKLLVIKKTNKLVKYTIRGGRKPVWSPRGDRIAFIQHRNGTDYVAMLYVQDGEIRIVCPGQDVAWFDYDRYLIIQRVDPMSYTTFVYRIRPDGREEKYLSEGITPLPDPLGDFVVVSVRRDGKAALRIIDRNGAAIGTIKNAKWASWSSDGKSLTYTKSDTRAIYLWCFDKAELASGNAEGIKISDDGCYSVFSHNGKMIAYSGSQKQGIYVYTISDTAIRRISDNDVLASPRWAPDDSSLLIADPDTKELIFLPVTIQ